MFQKFSNSYQIMKQCFAVLRHDRELLLFPLLSTISLILVTASFALPLMGTDIGQAVFQDDKMALNQEAAKNPIVWVVLFAFYFVNYFVITFFNSALVSCAIVRFNGGDPTVSSGLSFAWKRLPQIAAWALLAATVGMILKAIEQNKNIGAQIAAGLFGLAWSLATYFVVPIIIVEKANPVEALKRSTEVMRRTWGEAFITGLSVGPIQLLAMLFAMVPFLLSIPSREPAIMIAGGVISFVLMLGVILVFATLSTILLAALYLFASNDKVVPGFDREMMQTAFLPKGE